MMCSKRIHVAVDSLLKLAPWTGIILQRSPGRDRHEFRFTPVTIPSGVAPLLSGEGNFNYFLSKVPEVWSQFGILQRWAVGALLACVGLHYGKLSRQRSSQAQ